MSKNRFVALDAARGVAALTVVLFHFGHYTEQSLFRGAWAAVDLFFLLSGFVIHHSYGRKILGGMTFVEFFRVRLVRLYPLYLIGLIIGVVAMTMRTQEISLPAFSKALSLSLLGLPYPNKNSWPLTDDLAFTGAVFPFNGPSWSLFFESFVGLVYYSALRICRARISILAALFVAAWILCMLKYMPINPGPFTHGFFYGFPRSIALFFVGVATYEIYRKGYSRYFPSSPVFYLSSIVAICCAWQQNDALNIFSSLVLPPIIVLSGANASLPAMFIGTATKLGDISYALYATHVPLFALLWQTAESLNLARMSKVLMLAALVLMLATVFTRIDKHVRKYLQRKDFVQKTVQAA